MALQCCITQIDSIIQTPVGHKDRSFSGSNSNLMSQPGQQVGDQTSHKCAD